MELAYRDKKKMGDMVVLVVVYVSNSPHWAPIVPRSAESIDPLSSTSASARYLQCPAKEP